MRYTKYETKILNGIIPVYKVVRLDALQKIYDKALKVDDTDVIQKVLPRLDYLKRLTSLAILKTNIKSLLAKQRMLYMTDSSGLCC